MKLSTFLKSIEACRHAIYWAEYAEKSYGANINLIFTMCPRWDWLAWLSATLCVYDEEANKAASEAYNKFVADVNKGTLGHSATHQGADIVAADAWRQAYKHREQLISKIKEKVDGVDQ